jgi:transposase
MKVGQKTIVRWVSKLVATGTGRTSSKKSLGTLRELSAEQLRQVGGGDGSSTQSPNKGW